MIAWLLVACGGDPDLDAIGRALVHGSRPGETVGVAVAADRPLVEPLAARAGLDVADGADWIVVRGAFAPADRRRVAVAGELVLWGPTSELAAADVAVRAPPPEATAIGDAVFAAWTVHPPVAAGGELVAELFLRPPARMPLDVCVRVRLGDAELDGGRLLDGRVPLWPGVEARPLVRHRLRAAVPAGLSGAPPAALRLVDCSTGTALADAPAGEVSLGRGLPDDAALRSRGGEPDPDALFGDPAAPRPAMRRTAAGTFEPMAPPPLPRLLRGEVWPLVVGGLVDPTGWEELARDAPAAPLAGLQAPFAHAGVVVALGAPATREGEVVLPDAPPWVPPRRAPPEWLRVFAAGGVHAVLLGTEHADDAGPVGLADTASNARALGLVVGDAAPAMLTLPDGGPTVAIVSRVASPEAAASLPAAVTDARRHAAVVLVALDGADDRAAYAAAIAASGADGGWLFGDALGPIDVIDGVPVVRSLPPLLFAAPGTGAPTALLRLYVDDLGVRRIDVVAAHVRAGRVERDEDGLHHAWLAAMAEASRPLGSDVRVGRSVAAIDTRAHWPDRPRPAPTEPPPPPPPATDLPTPTLPARCRGEAPPDARPIGFGDALELLSVRLVADDRPVGAPVVFEALWRARRPLEAGEIEWTGTGDGGRWRLRRAPCDGVWGFERWRPGEVIRDVVAIFPPEGVVPGYVDFSIVVHSGGRTLDGPEGRRFAVGSARIVDPGDDVAAGGENR